MSQNIVKFISTFDKTKETSRSCNFESVVYIPASLQASYPDGVNSLRMRCEASELPSRNFSTVDQKTYGPVQTFPVQNFYDKINLVFICSGDMQEKQFFDRWMNYISVSTRTSSVNNDRLLFDFEYRNNYTTSIEILQYDLAGNLSYVVKLQEVYPIAVNAISLSWDATNRINKLPVTFSYRYFDIPN